MKLKYENQRGVEKICAFASHSSGWSPELCLKAVRSRLELPIGFVIMALSCSAVRLNTVAKDNGVPWESCE
ncbi:hypothetical protein P7K49_036497, partial [Saguinus oedipus]